MSGLGGRFGQMKAARALANMIWLGSEKVLQLAFSAITVGLIARILGTEMFGEFQFVLSALFVFSAIGLLAGSETAAPQIAACQDATERRRLLGSIFALRIASGTLACGAMALWSVLTQPPDRVPLLLIMAVSLVFTEPFNVLRMIREVGQNTRIIAVIRLFVLLLKFIVIGGSYFLYPSIMFFVLVYTLEFILIAACYLAAIRDDGRPWEWQPSLMSMKRMLRNGFTVWIGLLALILIQRMDRLMLERRLEPEVYGQYTAALSLLDSAWFFGPVMVAALAPSMVYRHLDRIGAVPWRFPLIVTGIAFGIVLTIEVSAPYVIPLIFGPDFVRSIHMIQLGALIIIPGFFALSLDAILIRSGHHYAVTVKWAGGLLVGTLLIIPDLGMSWRQGPLAIALAYTTSGLLGIALHTRAQLKVR